MERSDLADPEENRAFLDRVLVEVYSGTSPVAVKRFSLESVW